MIIVAPRTGPVIAGSFDLSVNTPAGGSRYVATGFASERVRGGIELRFEKGRINRHAAPQCYEHRKAALTLSSDLLLSDNRREGRAVMKPMAPSYRPGCTSDDTSGCQSVVIMTVTTSAVGG